MKKISGLLTVVLSLVMIFTLIACAQGGNNTTEPQGAEGRTIGFGLIWRNDQWWKDLEAAADAKAAELGFTLLKHDANLDAQKQVGQLEAMVAQGVDGIMFAPADGNATSAIVADAKEKDIPVITLETILEDPSNITTQFIFDPEGLGYQVGKYAAEFLNENYGGVGKYVVITDPTNNVIFPKGEGFHRAMKEFAPNAEMLTDIDGKSQRETAASATENLLTAHREDLHVFFGAQTEMGIGIAGVLDAQNVDPDQYFVGCEGWWDEEFYDYLVNKGLITAIAITPGVPLGVGALELFADFYNNGTPFPPVVEVDAVIVSTQNVSEHLDEWHRYLAAE